VIPTSIATFLSPCKRGKNMWLNINMLATGSVLMI
jgi:hypothetical protein